MNSTSPVLTQAWDKYYKKIDELRQKIEATNRFKTRPEHRAEAYHALMEAQAMAYVQIPAVRMNNPRVYTHTACNTTIFTLGQNCSDALYSLFALHGKQTYRVNIRKGDIKVMLFQTYNHHHGHPDCKQMSNHDVYRDFTPNANGSYEIIFSATQHEGNWIPLSAESGYHFIQLRRFYADWFDDMGTAEIEMLGEFEGYEPASEEAMAERIEAAIYFVEYMVDDWCIELYRYYIKRCGGKNKVGYVPGKEMSHLLGSPSTTYTFIVGDCQPDEAIIVEMAPPKSPYWGWQLGTVWSKPMEIVFNQCDVNMHRIVVDADGKCRTVIAHTDPGVANWLGLICGSTEYILVGRNYNEQGTPAAPATMRIVKLAELQSHLPKDTRRVTAEERKQALLYRANGNKRLFDNIQA